MKHLKFLLSLAVAMMIVAPVLADDVENADALTISGAADVQYVYTSMTNTDNLDDSSFDNNDQNEVQSLNGLTTDSAEINFALNVAKGNLTAGLNLECADGDDDELDVEDVWFNYVLGPVQIKTDLGDDIVRYADMDDRFGSAGGLGIEISTTAEVGVGGFLTISDYGFSYVKDDQILEDSASGSIVEDTSEDYAVDTIERKVPVFGLGVTFVAQGDVAGETVNTTDLTAGVMIDAPMMSNKNASHPDGGGDDPALGEEEYAEANDYLGYMGFLSLTQLLPVAQGMKLTLDVNYAVNMFGFLEPRVNDLLQYGEDTPNLGGTKTFVAADEEYVSNGDDAILGIVLGVGVAATEELEIGLGFGYLYGERGIGLDGDVVSGYASAYMAAGAAGQQTALGLWATNATADAMKIAGYVEYVLNEKTTINVSGYYQLENLSWEYTAVDEAASSGYLEEGETTDQEITTIDVVLDVDHAFDDNFALGASVEYETKDTVTTMAGEDAGDITEVTMTTTIEASYSF